MNIAVFGYYNTLNEGDIRLQYSITRLLRLEGHKVTFFSHSDPPPSTSYLRRFDWILIGGGGLVFKYHGIWVNMKTWLRRADADIGVFGLGVNNLNPGNLRQEIDDLAGLSSFFFVRDQQSLDLVGSESVQLGTDLTWMYPLSVDPSIDTRPGHIAVNLAHSFWKPYDAHEWGEQLRAYGAPVLPFPFYMTEDRDCGLLREVLDMPVHNEFSDLPLRRAEILVGARFHSLLFATMLRTPFVAIAYDRKIKRLCDAIGVSEFCLETDEVEKLPRTLDALKGQYEEVGQRLDDYATRQTRKAEQMKETITTAIAESDRRRSPTLASKVRFQMRRLARYFQ